MIWAAVYCEQLTEIFLKKSQQPRSPSVSALVEEVLRDAP